MLRMADDFYCETCRRSDSRGTKHVYSQKHKERIKIILRKFEEKMLHANDCLSKGPVIATSQPSDQSDNFWCPFCSAEVHKHEMNGNVTARFRNWAEHLCSIDHHKNVHNFFWRNKLDMKKRDKYKLSQGKVDEFKSVFETAIQRFHEETQQAVQEEASRIRTLEMKRAVVREQEVKTEIPSYGSPTSSHLGFGTVYLNTASKLNNGDSAFQGTVKAEEFHRMNLPPKSPTGALRSNVQEHPVYPSTLNQEYKFEPQKQSSSRGLGAMPDGKPLLLSSVQSHPSPSAGHWEPLPGPSGGAVERDPLMSPFIHATNPSYSQAASSGKMRTTVISSGGLTVISRKKTSLRGNIHTGAVPPWMMDDEDDDDEDDSSGKGRRAASSLVIGPTEDDFKKHLESERKRKLNPNRVGANFDHSAETSDDWLPSFGRVWNHGPRWRSRKHYKQEAGSKVKKLKK